MFNHVKFMELALEKAKEASILAEVPVGALIADEHDNIISIAHNKVESEKNCLNHAEMLVIEEAQKKLQSKNLSNCRIYITLEPCAMCATAISYAKLSKIIYGAEDKKFGAIENNIRLFNNLPSLFKPEIISGIMADECKNILQNFFKDLR